MHNKNGSLNEIVFSSESTSLKSTLLYKRKIRLNGIKKYFSLISFNTKSDIAITFVENNRDILWQKNSQSLFIKEKFSGKCRYCKSCIIVKTFFYIRYEKGVIK